MEASLSVTEARTIGAADSLTPVMDSSRAILRSRARLPRQHKHAESGPTSRLIVVTRSALARSTIGCSRAASSPCNPVSVKMSIRCSTCIRISSARPSHWCSLGTSAAGVEGSTGSGSACGSSGVAAVGSGAGEVPARAPLRRLRRVHRVEPGLAGERCFERMGRTACATPSLRRSGSGGWSRMQAAIPLPDVATSACRRIVGDLDARRSGLGETGFVTDARSLPGLPRAVAGGGDAAASTGEPRRSSPAPVR